MTLRRAVFITGIVVLCVWTLLPIYLIALGAVGGHTVVNSWPKPFLSPADLSFATMREFLDIAGVWTSALYSVEAAVLLPQPKAIAEQPKLPSENRVEAAQ